MFPFHHVNQQAKGPNADVPSMPSLLALLDSMPAVVWETDLELNFTCLTGVALQAMGCSAASFAARNVSEFFGSGRHAQNAQQAHQLALLGRSASFEATVNGRDLHANVRPRCGALGDVTGVIGVALDMTERLVAERAWRLSEHGYRSLVEEAPYAICRATIGGQLLQVNRAMAEMLGYEGHANGELLLRDLPLIFTPAESFEAFETALLETGSHPPTDATWLCRKGNNIQVRVSGRVVQGPRGEISHLDIFAENVTEKKRLEAELSHAQRMQAIGQLAGGVAHDFNNLLTVISGHVEMLLSNTAAGASRDWLREVQDAAGRAASLTRQLLAFSRRQVLRNRDIDLNEVITKLTAMLVRLLKENVELIFLPGDDLGYVNADPNEIERVLLNLAVNAQDAMPSGGSLTIQTSNVRVDEPSGVQPDDLRAGEYVQIVVQDTGLGMDRETQARVFEPFFTTKQTSEGTGLGLSVVYGIVRQSGGYIRVESQLNAGTSFRIYLPRVANRPAPAAEAPPARALPRGSETVLVAEDDAAIRRLVVFALEGLGYRVLNAPDGAAALQVADSHSGEIHLLLTDLVMPTVGGRELAASVKAASPAVKVVFISGYAGHAPADKGMELTGQWFLQKPFSMDLLANTVRQALDGLLP